MILEDSNSQIGNPLGNVEICFPTFLSWDILSIYSPHHGKAMITTKCLRMQGIDEKQ
jgi:hypothetical protein